MDTLVKKFLSNRHITVPNDWLRECIQFIYEDAGQQATQPNWAQANIPKLVYDQWLEANLRDLESSCLPPNLKDIKKTVINGYFALQVNSLLDISQSAYQQCKKIEGVDQSNSEVTAEPVSQKNEKSNRMLKLEMTDGIQIIHGMEYEEIPSLNVNLPPGTKVIVFGTVECRRGILLLTKGNFTVLGGQVEDLSVSNNQLQLLRRILNISDSTQASQQDGNDNVTRGTMVLAVPQASVSQEYASQALHNFDEDETIWQEDIENFDPGGIESQSAVASPGRNNRRPSLTAINDSILNQVDFDGFDDDEDF